jgi:hypothetical protein
MKSKLFFVILFALIALSGCTRRVVLVTVPPRAPLNLPPGVSQKDKAQLEKQADKVARTNAVFRLIGNLDSI